MLGSKTLRQSMFCALAFAWGCSSSTAGSDPTPSVDATAPVDPNTCCPIDPGAPCFFGVGIGGRAGDDGCEDNVQTVHDGTWIRIADEAGCDVWQFHYSSRPVPEGAEFRCCGCPDASLPPPRDAGPQDAGPSEVDAGLRCCPAHATLPCNGGEVLGGMPGPDGCETNEHTDGTWVVAIDADGCTAWRPVGGDRPGDRIDPREAPQCCNCPDAGM